MKAYFAALLAIVLTATGLNLQAQPLTPDPMAQATPDPLLVPAPSPQLMDLIPTYPVENMARAVDFYTNKLGFVIVLQAGGNYTAVGRDLTQIGLALNKAAAKGPKSASYINMKNIDIYYKELVARGVKMTRELKTQPSKMREFSVVDPDGNSLTFGEYMAGR